jgi:hypothetical protein
MRVPGVRLTLHRCGADNGPLQNYAFEYALRRALEPYLHADGCEAGQMRDISFISALILFMPFAPAQAEDLMDLSAPPHNRLGLAFPGGLPENYVALSNAGIGVVRVSVPWEFREPAPGQYQ